MTQREFNESGLTPEEIEAKRQELGAGAVTEVTVPEIAPEEVPAEAPAAEPVPEEVPEPVILGEEEFPEPAHNPDIPPMES